MRAPAALLMILSLVFSYQYAIEYEWNECGVNENEIKKKGPEKTRSDRPNTASRPSHYVLMRNDFAFMQQRELGELSYYSTKEPPVVCPSPLPFIVSWFA